MCWNCKHFIVIGQRDLVIFLKKISGHPWFSYHPKKDYLLTAVVKAVFLGRTQRKFIAVYTTSNSLKTDFRYRLSYDTYLVNSFNDLISRLVYVAEMTNCSEDRIWEKDTYKRPNSKISPLKAAISEQIEKRLYFELCKRRRSKLWRVFLLALSLELTSIPVNTGASTCRKFPLVM